MKQVSLAIIQNQNKEFLFYLRDSKQEIAHPNYWALIGGSIEENENPLEALEREIKEEIGIKVEEIKFLKIINVRGNELCYDHDIHLFKAMTDKVIEQINLTEGQEIKYFSFKEFINLKFPDFLKEFIIKNKEMFN